MRGWFIRVQALTTLLPGRRNVVVTVAITDDGTYWAGFIGHERDVETRQSEGHKSPARVAVFTFPNTPTSSAGIYT